MDAILQEDAHAGDLVAIAPARGERPGGRRSPDEVLVRLRRPPGLCPFCPGKEDETPPATLVLPRQGAWTVRVVPNLFPALPAAVGRQEVAVHGRAHMLRVAEVAADVLPVIGEAWARRIVAHREAGFPWVVPLVNEGAASGSSLDHTHSQLVATRTPPPRLARECARAEAGRDVLDDVEDDHVVHADDELVAFAPRASRSSLELRVARLDADADPADEGLLLARALGLAARAIEGAAGEVSLSIWLHHAPPGVRGPRWHLEALPRLGVLGGMELGVGIGICQTAPAAAAASLRAALAPR